MKKDNYLRIAALIILITALVLKGQFLMENEVFSDDESYKYLLEIEEFKGNSNLDSKHIYQPDEGYSEFKPLYIVYGIAYMLIPNILTIKVIELLQFGILIGLVYFLTKETTQNRFAAIFSMIILISSPIIFIQPQNNINPHIFLMNLFLLSTIILLKSSILFENKNDESYVKNLLKKFKFNVSKKHFRNHYILSIFILITILATAPAHALLFELTLIIFLFGLSIFNINSKKYFSELIMFSSLAIMGGFILAYKNKLLTLGLKVFTLNSPMQLVTERAKEFGVVNLFVYMGAITILGGIYATYFYLNNTNFKESRKSLFYSSAIISGGLLYVLKIGESKLILLFICTYSAILISTFLSRWVDEAIKNYFLKITETSYWIIICIGILIGASALNYSFAAALNYDSVDINTINAYKAIGEYEAKGIVVSSYNQGNLINYFSKKQGVMGNDFFRTVNPEKGLTELKTIYTNINSIKVKEILNEYSEGGIKDIYIYYDSNIGDRYNISSPKFDYDTTCFKIIYETKINRVYQYVC